MSLFGHGTASHDALNLTLTKESQSFLLTQNHSSIIDLPESSLVFQTSGSSGEPKGIVLSRRAMHVSAAAVNDFLCVTKKSIWGLLLPWWHVGGYSVITRATLAGCDYQIFPTHWQPKQAVEWLTATRITHLSLVPTQVYDLVQEKLLAPQTLQCVVVGGGKISPSVKTAASALGWKILSSYGMTEAASQIATDDGTGKMKILPHWQIRLTPENLLEIQGDALFSGYWQEGKFLPRKETWFCTQDIVALSENYLTPLGRADRQIKILGELVHPLACEEKLIELGLEPEHFILIAEENERTGSALVLLHELSHTATVTEILSRYNAQVKGYERISAHRYTPSLTRSAIGKILRPNIF